MYRPSPVIRLFMKMSPCAIRFARSICPASGVLEGNSDEAKNVGADGHRWRRGHDRRRARWCRAGIAARRPRADERADGQYKVRRLLTREQTVAGVEPGRGRAGVDQAGESERPDVLLRLLQRCA